MNTFEAIINRKSIRAYLDKEIPAETISKILEAGQWAPNAGPFQISVIRNAQLRKKINDQTLQAMLNSGIEFMMQRASIPGYQPLYDAPVILLISAPNNLPHAPYNAGVVAENMLLQATELCLGSCFLRSISLVLNNNQAVITEAGIPDDYTFHCGVALGYSAAENKFSPSPSERVKRGEVKYID